MLDQFLLPLLVIDAQQRDDVFMFDLELFKIEIVRAGQPADWRFDGAAFFFAAIDDPFQDAHVIAETGPKKFSALAFAEPIHVEDERRIR